jgi:hypothetical protein
VVPPVSIVATTTKAESAALRSRSKNDWAGIDFQFRSFPELIVMYCDRTGMNWRSDASIAGAKGLATPAGVRGLNGINGLEWQTTLTVSIGTQRLFALVANPDQIVSVAKENRLIVSW